MEYYTEWVQQGVSEARSACTCDGVKEIYDHTLPLHCLMIKSNSIEKPVQVIAHEIGCTIVYVGMQSLLGCSSSVVLILVIALAAVTAYTHSLVGVVSTMAFHLHGPQLIF